MNIRTVGTIALCAIAFAIPCYAAQAGSPPGPTLLAMGPDPGGHTGAGVTPETTKTDRPEVDAARKAKSGSKVETNPDKATQPGETRKRAN